MWHVHATEYYASLKRNGGPIYATTWMNFEHIVLSTLKSWSQKTTYCMMPYIYEMSRIGKSIEIESTFSRCQGLRGGEDEEWPLSSYKLFFWSKENALNLDHAANCTTP